MGIATIISTLSHRQRKRMCVCLVDFASEARTSGGLSRAAGW